MDSLKTLLRPIDPDDIAELKDGLQRLSPETRTKRFHFPVSQLSNDQWRYLTHVDGIDHVAYVACLEEDFEDAVRGSIVGVARFIRDTTDPRVAEVAFVVHDRVQRRGIGRALRDALCSAARDRGIEILRAHVQSSNYGVRRLLETPSLIRLRERDGAIDFTIAA